MHPHMTYHRFVKTTPKPRATKKSRGELVGPPLPPSLLLGGWVDEGAEVKTAVVDMAMRHYCSMCRLGVELTKATVDVLRWRGSGEEMAVQ